MSDERPALSANDAWSVLAASLEPLPLPAGARDRLLEAIDRAAPYRSLLPGLAAVFDLTATRADELLARMQDAMAWKPGAGGIIAYLDFHGGPRLGPAHCGVARVRSGATLPRHTHKAREVTFVLRGGLTDGDGTTYGAGQVVDAPAGSSHSLRVTGEPEALLAILLAEIEIDRPA